MPGTAPSTRLKPCILPLVPLFPEHLPQSATSAVETAAFQAFQRDILKVSSAFLHQLGAKRAWIPGRKFLKPSSGSWKGFVVETFVQAAAAPPMEVRTVDGRVVRFDSGVLWHSRISRHEDISWSKWTEGLLENYARRQLDIVEGCTAAKCVQVIHEGLLEGTRFTLYSAHTADTSLTVWQFTREPLCSPVSLQRLMTNRRPAAMGSG